jgi:hypothetical protein
MHKAPGLILSTIKKINFLRLCLFDWFEVPAI